jgi:hypothetical protein
MIGTFPEKYGRAEMEHPDFGTGIRKMGADAPIPPRARSAAAPEGAPPRRIREGKTALAPPCPVRGPEAGGHRNFLEVWKISRGILGFPATSAKSWFWLSSRPKQWGGIGHRVRAFQPSRVLSRIMHPHKPTECAYSH